MIDAIFVAGGIICGLCAWVALIDGDEFAIGALGLVAVLLMVGAYFF